LSLTDLTPTPNATTSPEGLQNAYKVLTGTAGSEQIAYQATGTSGNIKTQSVYIKADSGVQWIRFFQLRSGFANSASCWFDIQNGVKGSKSEGGTTSVVDDATKIEDAGNGWYRLILVCTDSTNNTTFDTRIRTANSNGSGTRVSNGSYFVWGLQMESDASYPTSYIPNHSGGSVTRGADDLNDLSVSENNEGTFYFETKDRIFENESSNKNYLGLIESSSGNYFRFRGQSSSILIQSIGFGSNISFNPSGANLTKYLYKWDGTTIKVFVDGVERGSVSQTARFEPDTFRKAGGGSIGFSSNLKQLLIFTTALPDNQCIALTS